MQSYRDNHPFLTHDTVLEALSDRQAKRRAQWKLDHYPQQFGYLAKTALTWLTWDELDEYNNGTTSLRELLQRKINEAKDDTMEDRPQGKEKEELDEANDDNQMNDDNQSNSPSIDDDGDDTQMNDDNNPSHQPGNSFNLTYSPLTSFHFSTINSTAFKSIYTGSQSQSQSQSQSLSQQSSSSSSSSQSQSPEESPYVQPNIIDESYEEEDYEDEEEDFY